MIIIIDFVIILSKLQDLINKEKHDIILTIVNKLIKYLIIYYLKKYV